MFDVHQTSLYRLTHFLLITRPPPLLPAYGPPRINMVITISFVVMMFGTYHQNSRAPLWQNGVNKSLIIRSLTPGLYPPTIWLCWSPLTKPTPSVADGINQAIQSHVKAKNKLRLSTTQLNFKYVGDIKMLKPDGYSRINRSSSMRGLGFSVECDFQWKKLNTVTKKSFSVVLVLLFLNMLDIRHRSPSPRYKSMPDKPEVLLWS